MASPGPSAEVILFDAVSSQEAPIVAPPDPRWIEYSGKVYLRWGRYPVIGLFSNQRLPGIGGVSCERSEL